MNTFNFKRFAQVLKWYLVQNKDTLLRWSAGSAIGIFLFQMFSVVIGKGSNYTSSVDFSVSAGVFLLGIAVLVAASSVFDFAKTKQRRIALLSLPASNGEKYASALVYSLIVWPLCMVLALVVGDLLRASFMWLIGQFIAGAHIPFYSGLPTLWENFGWLNEAFIYAFNLWVVSLYVLGGSLFRRSQFVITSGFHFVLFIVATWILSNSTVWNEVHSGEFIFVAFFFMLAAVNFLLSYRCFCRMQAVSGKWLNVSLRR